MKLFGDKQKCEAVGKWWKEWKKWKGEYRLTKRTRRRRATFAKTHFKIHIGLLNSNSSLCNQLKAKVIAKLKKKHWKKHKAWQSDQP